MSTVERRYALSKVASGDYLLPSNDAQTIWRIHTYEDGPSKGLDWPRDRQFWAVRRWLANPIASGRTRGEYVDVEDWDRWELWSDMYVTRADAVQAALNDS